MKISHRSHPILEKLHNGSLGTIPTLAIDNLFVHTSFPDFNKHWNLYYKDFSSEINIITEPFAEAAQKAQKKLIELAADIFRDDKFDFSIKGCYVYDGFTYMVRQSVSQGSPHAELAFYMFSNDGIPIAYYINNSELDYQSGWISQFINLEKENETLESWIYRQYGKILALAMFKSYAQVETKILLPNSKTKGILCKYVNQTKLKLTYLDSKWFTNLVKSDGFNVRGHFRLQPMKKNGEWTKELIWISEFEKTGYTAPARKIAAYA
jgi:hypothetical protein